MSKEMKIVPELRFPEFENKGEWENDELGNHCDITTGKLDANAMVENGKYRFYTCAKDYYFIDNYAFDTDALLISGNGAHVGYIHHYKGKFNAYQRTYVLDKFDKDIHYVQYFLERNLKGRIASEKKDGNTPYIVRSTLSEMEILSPKSEIEQQKIASCLSSLDELLAAHNDKLDALKDHKKGLMQNLFPQEGETVPKVRFPEFEGDGDWVKKSIGSVAKVSAGGTPTSTEPKYWGGNIPWMNSGELNLKRVYSVANYITQLGLKESSTKKIPPLCVLIGLAGQGKTRGTAAINYIELCTNQSIAAIHPNKSNFDSEFLYHKIDSIYKTLRRLSTGQGGRGGLNLSIIREIEITFPSIEEQQKIVSCLSALDELINAQTEKIEQLQQHKKGLMQGLFPKIES